MRDLKTINRPICMYNAYTNTLDTSEINHINDLQRTDIIQNHAAEVKMSKNPVQHKPAERAECQLLLFHNLKSLKIAHYTLKSCATY
jgi:hypothetical protein